jgi:cell division protein FtsB
VITAREDSTKEKGKGLFYWEFQGLKGKMDQKIVFSLLMALMSWTQYWMSLLEKR